MSVLLELAMFPTDKGESVSAYVARIIAMIDGRNVDYRLTPMGTVIETDGIEEGLKVIADAYRELEPDCGRVYATVKLDIRKGKGGRLGQKIESVEKRLGKKPKT
ncbi:MAG: MTH1187 family thiamine-binding protein [Syntrophorhabdales bacterium]|jgi:uncharacterized protein (TIGR00106 family)